MEVSDKVWIPCCSLYWERLLQKQLHTDEATDSDIQAQQDCVNNLLLGSTQCKAYAVKVSQDRECQRGVSGLGGSTQQVVIMQQGSACIEGNKTFQAG